jgi:hypothetical protein
MRGTTRPGDIPPWPWWWGAYLARHAAERAARREASARTLDCYAELPMLIGAGEAVHLSPREEEEIVAVVAGLFLLAA